MGNKSSMMLQVEEIKQISDETGFSSAQIEKLYVRFAHLDRSSCGSLNKNDFLSIPELAINPLCDRIIQMFFSNSSLEDERINFRQFMRVLATFRSTNNPSAPEINHNHPVEHNSLKPLTQLKSVVPSNNLTDINAGVKTRIEGLNESLKNKYLFVFKVYDADNDARISFNDLRSILKMIVGNYIEDVQLDKIATRAFVEVDENNDGFIEFQEFCKVFSGRDLDDKLRVKFFN